MIRKTLVAGAVCVLAAQADFSYEQTSKITGGAMAGMMKVAGAFSRTAREGAKTTIMVKGDRMVTASQDSLDIIDLNAETFTHVDLKKKQYAVATFADMARAMQQMAERMGQKKNEAGADLQFSADVKNTGATKVISGLNTKQTVVTLSMKGTDAKSGESGAMDFVMDMWLAPDMPGYDEVRSFYTRMAQKVAWNPGGGMMGAMMAQHAKGMSELVKEMSKLDGVPVVQVTRIGAAGTGAGAAGAPAPQPQPRAEQQGPTAGDAAANAAAGAAANRSGRAGAIASGLGGFGGFGGFGRKKKKQQEEQAQPQPEPQAQAQAGPASVMEMTTELTGFSSAPVDGSKFEIPAGYKQVQHPMTKGLK